MATVPRRARALSGRLRGFLRRVIGIDTSNGLVEVSTVSATLEDAVEQKILLEVDGIDGVLISIVNDKQTLVGPEAQEIEDAYRLEGGFTGNESLISKDVIYRVQIGAFKNPISKNVFEGVNDLIVLKGDDGLTRYLTGSYRTIKEAAKSRQNDKELILLN